MSQIKYVTVAIEDVMHYYAKDFKGITKDNPFDLPDYEWFFDPVKGKVVFKVFVEDQEDGS